MTLRPDDIYELECYELKKLIRELLQNEVKEGDGSLTEKARHILEVGARHMKQGRPSKDFMDFISSSITSVISGDVPSFDHAFRLSVMGRPRAGDPYSDPVISVGLLHMMEFDATVKILGLPKQRLQRWRTARRHAVEKMYVAQNGYASEDDLSRGISVDTVKSRRDTLRRNLNSVVRYLDMDQKLLRKVK